MREFECGGCGATFRRADRKQQRRPKFCSRECAWGAQRIYEPWTAERWGNGFVDNRGRFRVFRPDFPRALPGGYALRAHVVWWLAHGEVHPAGTDIHHRDDDRLNDTLGNLELLAHGAHTTLHHLQEHEFICEECLRVFYLSGHRVASRRAEGTLPRFCSQSCYHAHPKSDETRAKMSESLALAYAEGRR